MKKILLVLCCALGIVSCSKELPPPGPEGGIFRTGTTIADAENILFDACAAAKWQIVQKQGNVLRLNVDTKAYNFDASIEYSASRYTINYEGVNRDRGNQKDTYAHYKKYVQKLNRTIQKMSSLRR